MALTGFDRHITAITRHGHSRGNEAAYVAMAMRGQYWTERQDAWGARRRRDVSVYVSILSASTPDAWGLRLIPPIVRRRSVGLIARGARDFLRLHRACFIAGVIE